ncbi:topoisomerase C-terminal repeat-containing protein [Bacillus cereus]|uniref:topoisomerase C-terminal repeat-containing protein n=1 Tax=Bacillus cereus TaxID=1396 RepID=UPI003D65533D
MNEKILGKKISSAQVKKLLKDGKTYTIKGFKKGEDLFDAVLSYNLASNKLEFKNPEIKEKVEKKELFKFQFLIKSKTLNLFSLKEEMRF